MSCILEEMHSAFDAGQNAKFGLGLLAFGVILILITSFVPGTSNADRVIGLGSTVIVAILGFASSVYANTFRRTLWELIAIPSPLYGALFWTVVLVIYVGKIHQILT